MTRRWWWPFGHTPDRTAWGVGAGERKVYGALLCDGCDQPFTANGIYVATLVAVLEAHACPAKKVAA